MFNSRTFTDYERRTVLSRNPLARLSHRARVGEALALIEKHLPAGGVMLDFGCAHGELLVQVKGRVRSARLYGLDPLRDGVGYTHLRSPAECDGLSFDLITAFEVLEHLDENGTDTFFRLASTHLNQRGLCIVSVPNMLGPALLPKLVHAALFSGSALHYSAPEVVRAALLLKSPIRLPPGQSRAPCATKATIGAAHGS